VCKGFKGEWKMCGRYLIAEDEKYFDEIGNIVNEISQKSVKSISAGAREVFPTNYIPVIYQYNGKNILSSAKWGFPGFKNKGVIINARAETIAEKQMFKGPFAEKRCIIPANGYYEWLTREDGKKIKYLIRVSDKNLFYMAGLYNIFKDKNEDPYAAVAIITTRANPEISFIHDRMPVILPDMSVRDWLDADNRDPFRLKSLLVPYSAGKMEYMVA